MTLWTGSVTTPTATAQRMTGFIASKSFSFGHIHANNGALTALCIRTWYFFFGGLSGDARPVGGEGVESLSFFFGSPLVPKVPWCSTVLPISWFSHGL